MCAWRRCDYTLRHEVGKTFVRKLAEVESEEILVAFEGQSSLYAALLNHSRLSTDARTFPSQSWRPKLQPLWSSKEFPLLGN